MRKIFVVGNDINYARWISNCEITENMEEADIVMFTGGEDVDPAFYGCRPHRYTYYNTSRDEREKAAFDKVRPDQLCVGICRGSQFMCVMNGGKLVQHVNGHAMRGTHPIYNMQNSEISYEITSTHHQMQYPFNLEEGVDYDTLYFTSGRSDFYEGDKINYLPYEPEIVIYHVKGKPKCLAIQGHPEMMTYPDTPTIPMLNRLIDEYVTKK